MKAVLISIRPEWCEKIANGSKTVEVRKTRPNIETPFKCCIYCTIGGGWLTSVNGVVQKINGFELDLNVDNVISELNGYVIGEFICDRIEEVIPDYNPMLEKFFYDDFEEGQANCLTDEELTAYGKGKPLYGWHISDLVIYDAPKELSEFYLACDKPLGTDCSNCIDKNNNRCKQLTRPPQSWCYVEGKV